MKLLLTLLATLALTGCASTCTDACILGFGPGSAAFDRIALQSDRADECQTGAGDEARRQQLNRPVGYTRPSFCGAAGKRQHIYDRNGRRLGYIK